MNQRMQMERARHLFQLAAVCGGLACGAKVDHEPQVDVPDDIYEEGVWDDADVEVRVAALRRDVEAEMRRLSAMAPVERGEASARLLELMSSLRAEWGKTDGGAEEYAKLEADVDALLEE